MQLKIFSFLCKIAPNCKFWSQNVKNIKKIQRQIWYLFIFHFNEQKVLQNDLAMIISLEAVLRRCLQRKFFKKTPCWSLVFDKVRVWQVLQNLQENSCVGVSFLIKLLAGSAIPTLNCQYWFWIACQRHFFIVQLIKKPKLFAPFMQNALTHNWKVQ